MEKTATPYVTGNLPKINHGWFMTTALIQQGPGIDSMTPANLHRFPVTFSSLFEH